MSPSRNETITEANQSSTHNCYWKSFRDNYAALFERLHNSYLLQRYGRWGEFGAIPNATHNVRSHLKNLSSNFDNNTQQ